MTEGADLLVRGVRTALVLALPLVGAAAATTVAAAAVSRWQGWQDAALGQALRLLVVGTVAVGTAAGTGNALAGLLADAWADLAGVGRGGP